MEPLIELLGRKDAQHRLHAVVAKAAYLRAQDGVIAGPGWREVDVLSLAGNGVLLKSHLGDSEAVNDVNGVEGEVDLATGGKDELGSDKVINAVRVQGVNAG